jgi:hypothetical protein
MVENHFSIPSKGKVFYFYAIHKFLAGPKLTNKVGLTINDSGFG